MQASPSFARLRARGASIALLLLALVACGRKGPLYLPEQVLGEVEQKKEQQASPAPGARLSPESPTR